ESDLAVRDQVLARDREIEKAVENEKAMGRACETLKEHCQALETDKSELQSKVADLERKLAEAEQLIKEVHESYREKLAESKPAIADHFTWKVNFFHENEVILNFFNRGLPMDLIEASSQPAVDIELPSERHIARDAEGKVRFFSKATLPQEFLVRIRMTAIAQETSFRIRPFAETKIERVYAQGST